MEGARKPAGTGSQTRSAAAAAPRPSATWMERQPNCPAPQATSGRPAATDSDQPRKTKEMAPGRSFSGTIMAIVLAACGVKIAAAAIETSRNTRSALRSGATAEPAWPTASMARLAASRRRRSSPLVAQATSGEPMHRTTAPAVISSAARVTGTPRPAARSRTMPAGARIERPMKKLPKRSAKAAKRVDPGAAEAARPASSDMEAAPARDDGHDSSGLFKTIQSSRHDLSALRDPGEWDGTASPFRLLTVPVSSAM